jgi:hypothetical protein
MIIFWFNIEIRQLLYLLKKLKILLFNKYIINKQINQMELSNILNPCVICLTDEAVYKNILCEHKLICKKCILDVVYKKRIPEKCPICKHKAILSGDCMGAGCSNNYIPLDNNVNIKNGIYPSCDTCDLYITLSYRQRKHLPEWFRKYEHIYMIWEKSNVIYYQDDMIDSMCHLLSKIKEYKKWNGLLCSFLEENDFLKYIDNRFYMLSIKQVDKVFDSMLNITDTKDMRIILLSLVKICAYPWELSRIKYDSALCRHGNYGGINPIGFEAIKIIEKNIKQYINKMEVSNYINSITDGYTVIYPENTHI